MRPCGFLVVLNCSPRTCSVCFHTWFLVLLTARDCSPPPYFYNGRPKSSSDVAAFGFADGFAEPERFPGARKECRELGSSRFIHPHCFAITLSVFIAGRGGLAAMGPFKPLGALI